MTESVRTAPAGDQLDTLVSVLDLVRTGQAHTRPDLGRRSGLGRTVITQRVQQLIDCGLLEEGDLGQSSGGRAPRELRFRADAGHLLELFQTWTPDRATQQRILVDNPAKLYGFPN